MCGIVGYVGTKQSVPILVEGLRRLEYRGYDSAGIAVVQNSAIRMIKTPGKIKDLDGLLKRRSLGRAQIGIAHTRWATHGAPTKANAHPHADAQNEFAVVHNGIIENYLSLRSELTKKGYRFRSQTDTETIIHLIADYYKKYRDVKKAFLKALSRLEGSFALVLSSVHCPERLFFARLGSPLIAGIGDGENFLASDASAILGHTDRVVYLRDRQAGEIRKDGIVTYDFSGKFCTVAIERIAWDVESAQKSGYPHFMLKEIHEQPRIMHHLATSEAGITSSVLQLFKGARTIVIVACGTAYHAGIVGKYVIEELVGLPVTVDVSSEFRYRSLILDKHTVLIAISQSGETADTLAAVREARRRGVRVVSICNVLGSSLTRESDHVLYTHAGPEIGVASTKAYTAQLMVLYLLAVNVAHVKNTISQLKLRAYLKTLARINEHHSFLLKHCIRRVAKAAERHHNFGCFLFLGRNVNYPSALEGALKLKEISYIPAEGYAAGEMKHGPIALIDEYRAVVCIAVRSAIYEKIISNIQEIEARKGKIVVIATEGDDAIKRYTKEVIYIPRIEELFSPLLVALPLQLFAYYVAAKRGCDIDQPRNLAKSVTVE